MNHSDIDALRILRANYIIQHRQYRSLNGGCGWLVCTDDIHIYGSPCEIAYPVSRWDRFCLPFIRPGLYTKYNLRPDYVYSIQDIATALGRIPTLTKKEGDALFHDMCLLMYDNEYKKWYGLMHASVGEIDLALGVIPDMTYAEYASAINKALTVNPHIELSGSKSRARNIIMCIIHSIDDKIHRAMTVIRPFGIPPVTAVVRHPEYM